MDLKTNLKRLLNKNVVMVDFTKADGTKRIMKCTLREDLIKTTTKSTKKTKPQNENVLCVWDVEKDAFRSFRLDSVIDYQKYQEGYEL